mgnify:CR=1 FL=1
MKRMKANTLMTALAWKADTSKVLANRGMTGATMPKPNATLNETPVSAATSGGSPSKYRERRLRI